MAIIADFFFLKKYSYRKKWKTKINNVENPTNKEGTVTDHLGGYNNDIEKSNIRKKW